MNPSSGSGSGEYGWLAAVGIPMVLMVAPGVGGFAGHWVDRKIGCAPVGLIAGVILGLIAAAWRVRQMLRKLSGEESK